MKKIKVCRDHISSIRAISVSRPQNTLPASEKDQSVILFTGGGRMLLKSWKLSLSMCNNYHLAVNQHNSHLSTTLLSELSKNENKYYKSLLEQKPRFMEGRIMALVSFSIDRNLDTRLAEKNLYFIAAACSDGLIRYYSIK